MAPRRNARQREAQLAFEALTIEGSLLSPEWLAKVAQLQAEHQQPDKYRVLKGLNLRDEIGRYWRIAQAKWSDFQTGLKSSADRQALADAFVVPLLRDSFGFESLTASASTVIGERIYPVRHRALGGRVPVVIAPAASGLDSLAPAFGEGTRRRSAFGLAQELLNADENVLWGLATDGVTLRLLRDNASLTRPAWIEADLGRIFSEERYADFAALWLVIHETRFGSADHPVSESALESWRAAGREEGTRAREHLRNGVEDALVALGRGFLVHPENQQLRSALHDGSLTKDAYFQQLLRLVYRLIFLLTAEERGVLHPAHADETARERYEVGYGLRRLRDRSVKRSAHDRFSDLWNGLKIVLRGVATGEPRLALPALGGLFAEDQCPDLDGAKLENRALLTAVFKLSWLREDSGLSRVNWRDMGPEELGSVYESLLELVPQIPEDDRGFSFATGDETKGNARKTTGSYYTPDSLVQVLLDSALEPVVQAAIATHPENPAAAVLALSVVDPACGSGHFLLAAARRLAGHVARLQANGTPSAAEYRHALREVVSRCVFGVDLNPMAVELCRVSLWMEAVEPGRPLSFLDSHIQQGNALLGATPELMAKGVPDAAWDTLEGDDKKTSSLLRKRNKAAAGGQRGLDSLWVRSGEEEKAEVIRAVSELDAASDTSLADVAGKEARWEELQKSAAFRHQRFVADAWSAAFVWPKPPIDSKKAAPAVVAGAPTNDLWRQIRDGQGTPPTATVQTVEELAARYRFFHWHLAFPQVFARGGFDVVLGNPPWERPKPEPAKYFAALRPDIARAQTSALREKLLAALEREDPALFGVWAQYQRSVLGGVHFQVSSGAYPLSAVGKFNLGNTFVERAWRLLSAHGRAGLLNVSGLATDESGKELIAELMQTRALVSFYDFENREGLFPGVHASYRFSAITLANAGARRTQPSDFFFFAHSVADLRDESRHIFFSAEDIQKLNPLSGNCPVFRDRRQAELVKAIYARAQLRSPPAEVLWEWDAEPTFLFVMSDHSDLFATREELELTEFGYDHITPNVGGARWLPLYESKMFHQFEHRWSSLNSDGDQMQVAVSLRGPSEVAIPRYWMKESDAARKLDELPKHEWLIALREVTNATNERTTIAALIPRYPVGHNAQVFRFHGDASEAAAFLACLNSFALDFAARTKVGGSHLSSFILRQLPILPCRAFKEVCPWDNDRNVSVAGWLLPRVLELTYTAWDLAPFARDAGYDGSPFAWDTERRLLLRAEIDGALFHLYGMSRDDVEYALDSFPVVRKNDQRDWGEYRTKHLILQAYDCLGDAMRTGNRYETRLDPAPVDPSETPEPKGPTKPFAPVGGKRPNQASDERR